MQIHYTKTLRQIDHWLDIILTCKVVVIKCTICKCKIVCYIILSMLSHKCFTYILKIDVCVIQNVLKLKASIRLLHQCELWQFYPFVKLMVESSSNPLCQYCLYLFLPVAWTTPSEWAGHDSSFYLSFDNVGLLILMEGTEMYHCDALVSGKVMWVFYVSVSKN